jgi:hypothetical protein
MSKLCLNMIVRNESRIILRLLESVYDLLDSYCICDTGSTDNTIELVANFFKEKGIPGKIIQKPFKDFGYNRTFALSKCSDMDNADYILLLDADMIIVRDMSVSPADFKINLIGGDMFYVLQGNDIFNYQNTRIVKNRIGATYKGVTHEYVSFPGKTVTRNIAKDQFFVHDIGDGGAKTDKAERDIRLLEQGLIDSPNNDRYTFYLANTYRDIKNYDKAIDLYLKRIEIGGWIEEIWYSHYTIGKLYLEMDKTDKAVYHLLEAYNVLPKRIENLYYLVKHYREKGNNHLAYNFFCLADYERNKTKEWDYLFTELDIYNFKLDYELSVIGYYCNGYNDRKYDMKNTCMKVLTNSSLDDDHCKNILSNYKFYTVSLLDSAISIDSKNQNLLSKIGSHFNFGSDFYSSTPSISFGKNNNELLICVRFVNYKITENGEYVNQDNITTKNVLATINISSSSWVKVSETILEYDSSIDNRYIGQEDVRILRKENNELIYTCNRCNQENKIKVEHGDIDLITSSAINSKFLSKSDEQDTEKNWCLFDNKGRTKCIYGWSPLLIGDISGNSFIETHKFPKMPGFFKHVRGSSNGIIVGDEIWFLCHLVSYEDRRYYYHIIVILDKETLNLKKYTNLFTFEKKQVEYTLGFVFFKTQNRFLIGYSLLDKETKYFHVSKHIFDNMMIT